MEEQNKILITTQLLMSLSDEFFTLFPSLIRNMEIVEWGKIINSKIDKIFYDLWLARHFHSWWLYSYKIIPLQYSHNIDWMIFQWKIGSVSIRCSMIGFDEINRCKGETRYLLFKTTKNNNLYNLTRDDIDVIFQTIIILSYDWHFSK